VQDGVTLSGREAYRYYKDVLAKYFGVPAKDAHADTVRRLFMPPEKQSMVQVSRPRDKHVLDWLAEWRQARDEDV